MRPRYPLICWGPEAATPRTRVSGRRPSNARASTPKVQQSLDAVRVIGNESVHPGQMDMTDDTDTARALFSLVNVIAEPLISAPKQVEAIFNSLPPSKLAEIEKRDS